MADTSVLDARQRWQQWRRWVEPWYVVYALVGITMSGAAPLLLPLAVARRPRADPVRGRVLLAAGAGGLGWMALQGFAIGIRGWSWAWLEALLGPLEARQFGMGAGALVVFASLLLLLTAGLAARGRFHGDGFVAGAVGSIVALVAVFVFFPVSRVLVSAVQDYDGAVAPAEFWQKLSGRDVSRL